jgi:uncharacterized protein (DUF2141 family)
MFSNTSRSFPLRASLRAACAATLMLASSAWAGDLIIKVKGAEAPMGKVLCWLFANSTGFPMDPKGAKTIVSVPAAAEVTCRFPGVAPGRYAVAIGHDTNGNGIIDTTPVGQPTEQWGVTNNARPAMRAPNFEESAFTMPVGDLTLNVEIDM